MSIWTRLRYFFTQTGLKLQGLECIRFRRKPCTAAVLQKLNVTIWTISDKTISNLLNPDTFIRFLFTLFLLTNWYFRQVKHCQAHINWYLICNRFPLTIIQSLAERYIKSRHANVFAFVTSQKQPGLIVQWILVIRPLPWKQ